MFEAFNHSGKIIGHILKTESHVVFFGNSKGTLETLQFVFPDWKFLGLKQIHSSAWTVSQKEPIKADAHFTSKTKKALYIKTADCMPIMLAISGSIAAIHAGWKGIANGIITAMPAKFNGAKAYIGPHIGRHSFKVGNEVIDKLMKAPVLNKYFSVNFCIDCPEPNKAYIDLAKMAQYQLQKSGITAIEQLDNNTFSHLNYYSYRRDGASSGRQISFIVRL